MNGTLRGSNYPFHCFVYIIASSKAGSNPPSKDPIDAVTIIIGPIRDVIAI